MRLTVYIILIFVLLASNYAQDPHYSQFYAAPLYLSPSFAGSNQNTRAIINFRDQWPKLPRAFITYSMSVDHYFDSYNSGAGILFMRDQAGGLLNTTNVKVLYSYNVEIMRELHFVPGIEASYYTRSINLNNLVYSDQYYNSQFFQTSVELPPEESTHNIDFAVSALNYYKNFWLGGTVDHLMKLSKSLQEDDRYAPIKISAFGGAKFKLNQRLLRRKDDESISTAFHYRTQDGYHQLDIGMYMVKSPLMIGLWYRGIPVFEKTKSHDAVTLLAGYKIENIVFSYSYDFTISRLITATGGAHEISLSYQFTQDNHKRRKRITAAPCPNIQ